MTTLKEILDALPKADRSALRYAFEFGLTQIVHFQKNEYIGVNLDTKKLNLQEVLNAGVWSYGYRNS